MASPIHAASTDPAAAPAKGLSARAVNLAVDRLEPARMVVLVGLCVYAGVSMFTEWWPVGWVNLAQARVFGAYSPLMSAAVSLFAAVAGLQVAVLALARFVARWPVAVDPAGSSLAAPRPTPGIVTLPRTPGCAPKPAIAQSRMLKRMGIGTIAAIWVAGAATFFWFDIHQRRDNQAVYAPLRFNGDSPIDVAMGDHVAVEGVVLASHALFYAPDSNSLTSSHYLIPVVTEDWHSGIPIRLLVQVDDRSNLPGYRASAPTLPWSLPEPVLGRVTSNASLIERTHFEKMGLQLAPDYRVLDIVESRGGKPVQQNVDYFGRVAGFAGAGSIAMALAYVAAYLSARRRERVEATAGGAKPASSFRQPRYWSGVRRCAPMGVACSLVGTVAGAWVALASTGNGYGAFAIAAPLSGLLCGAGAWWVVVVRVGRYTRRRGALAGALAVVCAHYLCWCLVMVSASAAQLWPYPPTAAAKDVPDAFGALGGSLVLTIWSLLLLGWATLPAGAILGAVIARRQSRALDWNEKR